MYRPHELVGSFVAIVKPATCAVEMIRIVGYIVGTTGSRRRVEWSLNSILYK